jgi:hypothetical protein
MSIAARDRTANDWIVLGLANAGQSYGIAGAYWLFQFRSPNARVTCTYAFAGAGVGIDAGLLPVDAVQSHFGARISGWRGFSAGDLDGAGGMVIDVGGDMFGLSFGTLRITAFGARWVPYFSYQVVPGPNSGLGIDASWIEGCWMLLSLRDMQTGKYWNAFSMNAGRPRSRL